MKELLPFKIYRDELLNFVRTITIKFTPFADQIDRFLYLKHETPYQQNKAKKKYYLNLVGDYYFSSTYSDTKMYIPSIDDDNKEILFHRNSLEANPKTKSLYYIGSNEYENLCKKYPAQKDLIKNIVLPACDGDIHKVIAAKNLTLIAYDKTFLHQNEQDILLIKLTKFLEFIEKKWHSNNYKNEDLFYSTFWNILFPNIFTFLLSQRLANMKTNHAHPFHIWEYLTSRGLKDYRTILTNKQSLWLYKNIDYILKNRGKMSNLYILSKNLLEEHYTSLVSKLVFSTVGDRAELCMTTPEIIDQKIDESIYITPNKAEFAGIYDFQHRLYSEGFDVKNDSSYVETTVDRLGVNPYNILQTKYLELKKNEIDTEYYNLLLEFILDTLMYKLSENKLSYKVFIKDPLTQANLYLPIQDAVVLLTYATWRSIGIEETKMFTKYVTRIPYKGTRPDVSEFNENVYIDNQKTSILRYIDIDKILNDIPWDNSTLTNPRELEELYTSQFEVLIGHVIKHRLSSDLNYVESMYKAYDVLSNKKLNKLNLTSYTDYINWFSSTDELHLIKTTYDNISLESELNFNWGRLADVILTATLPMSSSTLKYFGSGAMGSDFLYEGLKNLLIQLSSINIAYLDTSRTVRDYLRLPRITLASTKNDISGELEVDWWSEFWGSTYAKHSDFLKIFVNPYFTTDSDNHTHVNDAQLHFTITEQQSLHTNENEKSIGFNNIETKEDVFNTDTNFNVGISFEISEN